MDWLMSVAGIYVIWLKRNKFDWFPRALLFNATDSGPEARHHPRRANEPAMTITPTRIMNAYSNYRIVKIIPRGSFDFCSFPRSYAIPEKITEAMTLAGNAVPPVGAENWLRPILDIL